MTSDTGKPDPIPNSTAPLDEQLIAYLDGELDTETARQIETLVTADPQLRSRLDELEQTWKMLDALPRPEANVSLTETTLERVALQAEQDVVSDQAQMPKRRRRQRLVFGLGLLLACSIGFIAVTLSRVNTNRLLIENLPVLENLDEYRQTGNIDFLRSLDQKGLFPVEEETQEATSDAS